MVESSSGPAGRARPQAGAWTPGCDDVAAAVSRAREGDRDALRILYLRFAGPVRATVRQVVQDHHEAEDVTQQVFMKLMTILPRYQPRGVPFAAWLMRVARNMAIDTLRQRNPVPAAEIFRTEEAREDPGDGRAPLLLDALRELPADQREVVVLRHVVGLSPREIATRLGRSEASVHGLHHRGRSAVRQRLIGIGAAPLVSRARPVQAAA